jgi:hypothetical protein
MCLVTWQPSRLDQAVLDRIDGVLFTRHRLSREVECLGELVAERDIDATGLAEDLSKLGEGQALTWGLMPSTGDSLMPLRFSIGPRAFPKMRRLHLYLEKRVDPSERFYFNDKSGRTPPAGNLIELIDRLRTLDLAVVTFHFQRGDFCRWIRDVLHDERLTLWIERLQSTDLSGEELRLILLDVLEQRYRVLERLL